MSNDLGQPLAHFCLTLEQFRRSPEGRVRGEREFVAHFFPHDAKTAADDVFRFIPTDIRGPILSGWKIRGPKTALRDDDAKVLKVVHDGLVAGDVDSVAFESAFSPELLVGHVPLTSWWRFWRAGSLSERAILKALSTANELALFDATWFLDTLEMPASTMSSAAAKKGLDVLADGLSKADLTDWMRAIHQSADGSSRGVLLALGWERVVRHTRAPLLLAVLDRLAVKTGLASTDAAGAIARESKRPPETGAGS